MIQNDRELQHTKDLIASLRQARDDVFKQTDSTPFMMHLSAVSFERMMSQLLEQVEEYETRLKNQRHEEAGV
jgi:hypothetical protein